MIFISHRGNLSGPNPELENNPSQVEKVLENGYNCEIDIRYKDGVYWLGHDKPQYEVSVWFLDKNCDKLWMHCKDIGALNHLTKYHKNFNCFFHQTDDVVLTSQGFLWVYPGKELVEGSVCVMPERGYDSLNIDKCYGYCSDYLNPKDYWETK